MGNLPGDGAGWRAALLVVLFAAAPVAARAQLAVRLLDTVPPGIRLTNLGQVTLLYQVTGTGNGVRVDLFRDGAAVASATLPDPTNPPPPFRLTAPMEIGVDRMPNVFRMVATDLVTNQVVLGNTLTILADDVGPEAPAIASPVFPAEVPGTLLQVTGTVRNSAPGGPTQPETGGRMVIRRPGPPPVDLGGGAIAADARFTAVADVSGLPIGVRTDLEILAVDLAGNPGRPVTVQVTRVTPTPPTVTATLVPPPGTVTANPGILVRGTVIGGLRPLAVHFFVNGLLQSQLAGLAPGTPFGHTMNLPGPGVHTISIQATSAGGLPNASAATRLGTVTLSR